MNAPVPALLQKRADSPAIAFVIRGQPYSKSNRRKAVTLRFRDAAGELHTRPQFIKSDEARAYEQAALLQIPVACRVRLTGACRVTIKVFYSSERSDLDESVILDVLQDRWTWVKTAAGKTRVLVQAGVVRNDRQIREKHIWHGIDRANPRAEIMVEPLTPQQTGLPL
ncbi:hypothetical protein [Paraburkholderia adhaesiva]|uniref:hypothetical protein n=1 Tax=Paraburkholderia adhaesiva TaxID=2883244 RepID=UPI001F44432D|nr:hypothetical protein [Paraburkholderia adhaesiva]